MTVTVVHYHAPVIIGHCVELVVDNDITICACANRLHAERIARLIDRHGLVDVPDHINDWPAPTGRLARWRIEESGLVDRIRERTYPSATPARRRRINATKHAGALQLF